MTQYIFSMDFHVAFFTTLASAFNFGLTRVFWDRQKRTHRILYIKSGILSPLVVNTVDYKETVY